MGAVIIELLKVIATVSIVAVVGLILVGFIVVCAMKISMATKNKIIIIDCKDSLKEIKNPDPGFYLYRLKDKYYKYNGSKFFRVELF